MHIYYIIHYFPPELNGGATRASEMARLWAQAGHQVTVLTGFPNHPHGRVATEYSGRYFMEEDKQGYTIRRNWIYATPNKGSVKRIFNHTSLMVSSVLGSMFKPKPDVIIASSPPLFLGMSGYLLATLKHVPSVFEVRDIWPQQAIDLGMLTSPKIIQAMEWLEMFYYRKATKIIGVTQSTKRILSDRGVNSDKIEVIYNGTDLEKFAPSFPDDQFKRELGLEDKFVISYIGTMGLSQGLHIVLETAERIKDRFPQIHFLMVGDGADRDSLLSYSTEKQLPNVTFLPAQPREMVPKLYHLSDISLVLLKDLPLFRSTIPSKVFELMSCGLPIILGVKGEVEEIVRNANAGLCIEPENTECLTEAVIQMYNDSALRMQFAQDGPRYVNEHHNMQRLAERYLNVLEEATKIKS